MPVNTYACSRVIRPTKAAKIRLCLRVKRNRSDSLPTRPEAAQATAIDCGEITWPVTPPLVVAATNSTSLTPIWCAVVACNELNSALDEVSDPVRNTPSQPRNGEKNGNAAPVPANTSAMVEDMPEYLVTKA